MQSVSSRIWTRVAVSISYDDNHYTTGTIRLISVMFGESYPSAKMQSVNSAAPADLANVI